MSEYVYRRERGALNPLTIEAATGLLPTKTATEPTQYERLTFTTDLSGEEKIALDGYMQDAGYAPVSTAPALFHASTTVTSEEVVILSADWTDLGGVVTTPQFFCRDLTRLFGRVVGEYRSVGDGAQIRIVEDGARIMSPEGDLPDSGGVWALIPGLSTDVPSLSGQHSYRVQGRLRSATSGSIRFTSISLIESVLAP